MNKWYDIFKHRFISSYSDLDADYELIFDKECTLKEFLDKVLQVRANSASGYPFGTISINKLWNKYSPEITYEGGEITEVTHDIDLSQIITRVILHDYFGCNLYYEVETKEC